MTVAGNVVVGLAEAGEVLSDLMVIVERGLFEKEQIGAQIHRVELLEKVDFAHVFRQLRHDVLAHLAHHEHPHQRHVVVIGHEEFVLEVVLGVVLQQNVVHVAVLLHVEEPHVRRLKIHLLIGVVVVHFGGNWQLDDRSTTLGLNRKQAIYFGGGSST